MGDHIVRAPNCEAGASLLFVGSTRRPLKTRLNESDRIIADANVDQRVAMATCGASEVVSLSSTSGKIWETFHSLLQFLHFHMAASGQMEESYMNAILIGKAEGASRPFLRHFATQHSA
jgi:hypothetical protein